MILRIKEQRVPFGIPMLNGEAILIFIEELKYSNLTFSVKTKMINAGYVNQINPYQGYIIGLNNNFDFNDSQIDPSTGDVIGGVLPGTNSVIGIKLIKDKIKTTFDLVEEDFYIMSEIDWRHTDRPIRLFVPSSIIIKTPEYNALVNSLISDGTLYYEDLDGYILYLAEIFPEHRVLLEADPNVLIEEQ